LALSGAMQSCLLSKAPSGAEEGGLQETLVLSSRFSVSVAVRRQGRGAWSND